MGTETKSAIFWAISPGALKQVFGNKKNYDRYVAERQWNLWNRWLIALGYR